jgi:hypothetical protein
LNRASSKHREKIVGNRITPVRSHIHALMQHALVKTSRRELIGWALGQINNSLRSYALLQTLNEFARLKLATFANTISPGGHETRSL